MLQNYISCELYFEVAESLVFSFFFFIFPVLVFLCQSDRVDSPAAPLTELSSDEKCEDEVDLSLNALLWLGKDYSNFIKRDWTQLDQPYQGTQSYKFQNLLNTKFI